MQTVDDILPGVEEVGTARDHAWDALEELASALTRGRAPIWRVRATPRQVASWYLRRHAGPIFDSVVALRLELAIVDAVAQVAASHASGLCGRKWERVLAELGLLP